MSCSRFEEKIALYAGGDLDAAEVRVLEGHLRTCPACAELARALGEDADLLRGVPYDIGTADYSGMRRQIRRQIEIERRRKRLVPGLLAAAAVLLAIAVTALRFAPNHAEPARVRPPEVRPLSPHAPAVAQGSRPRRPGPRTVPRPDPLLEAQLREFIESQATAPSPPAGVRVATKNPDVILILLDQTTGESHE